MKDNEEFGNITIDDQPATEGWNKPVPYLNYWMASLNTGKLTKDQYEFYKYLKDCVKRGKYLSGDNLRGYLNLYSEELRKAFKSPSKTDRAEVLQQIMNLVTIYDFHSYELNEIMEKEEKRLRLRRINSYSIKDKAYWVPVGEELSVDGWKFVRGGFYWGKYVDFNEYNPKTRKYALSMKNEGPAIRLITDHDKIELIKGHPNSFVELSQLEQESLLNWLAGAQVIDITAFAVYLSGFEVRLLGDRSTTDSERVKDLRYLYDMLNNLPIITGRVHSYDSLATKWITNLIEFTLARYFVDNPESVLPADFVNQLPMIINARIDQGMANIIASGRQKGKLIEDFKQFVKPPRELPEVYHQAFYDKLASEYQNNARWYMSDFGLLDNSHNKYTPISYGHHYRPNEQIEQLLNVEPQKQTKAMAQVAEKLKLVYSRIMQGLVHFRRLVNNDVPILSQINVLPTWCDPSLMPEIEKVVAELRPAPGQEYRLMKVSDLMKFFSNNQPLSDSVDEPTIEYVRMCLYRLGLSIAYPQTATIRLKYSDTTAVYDKEYKNVPSRGTLQTSMFLIAWMIQAEKVTDADYAVIDQWLRDYANGANWVVPAQAVMRWLADHKLTMSAKRKDKARTLAKYPKKRDELQGLLLMLVNGEGFVLPKRMKRLETIYELIGLDPSSIHSDLHRLATEGIKKDAKPGKIAGKKGRASSTGMLNREKLKVMEQSTAKAQEILANVFEDEAKAATKANNVDEKKKKQDTFVFLIKRLAEKSEWTRAEFEQMISNQGETYGAMLEKLNDYSYDKIDEALVEDDGDTLYVDTEVASRLL